MSDAPLLIDPELLEAGIRLIEKTEIYAKMGGVPEFKGCTVEYLATLLIADDERFSGRRLIDVKWDLWADFLHSGRAFQRTHRPLWTTLTPDQWAEAFPQTN